LNKLTKNRIIVILAALVLILLTILILTRVLGPARLKSPESVAWDSLGNTFLISNAGNGKIISLDDRGKYKNYLSKGLKNPRGLKVLPPYLYVTDNTQIHAIDLETRKIADSITIDGAKMLNDIEADRDGRLYVTDTKADRLFIVNPATRQVQSISSPLLAAPNGIVFDYPRKQMLLVCLKKASPVLSFNVDTSELAVFKETLYDNLDGIAIDDLGRIYFSSWGESAIFVIPQAQNRFENWKSGLESPADIYYHQPTNELIVPLFEQNRIERFRLD